MVKNILVLMALTGILMSGLAVSAATIRSPSRSQLTEEFYMQWRVDFASRFKLHLEALGPGLKKRISLVAKEAKVIPKHIYGLAEPDSYLEFAKIYQISELLGMDFDWLVDTQLLKSSWRNLDHNALPQRCRNLIRDKVLDREVPENDLGEHVCAKLLHPFTMEQLEREVARRKKMEIGE